MATPGTEEELKFYLRFAKPLALNLKDPSDRVTASAWIRKLKNEEFGALKTRTDHVKVLLFVLQKKRLVGRFSENPSTIEKLEDFSEEIKLQDIARQLLEADLTERRRQAEIPPPYYVEYSPDLKEYASSQEIPNFGIQGYYAFSKEPIFLWYKSEKVKLPKDVMEFDGDALHGIHLPLSSGEISRPRLPRSPDKSKPKTISALEKSIAELEGKSGATENEEAIVPIVPIGSPRPEDDRESPSWGSNLGTVSEPPEKEISSKAGAKSPAVKDIEGDILEDEHPPSFLDISSASSEHPSPAVCPFAASPRKQSPYTQKPVEDIEGDILEDEYPPSFLDISGASPGKPSPAVCPFVTSSPMTSTRRQSPPTQKADSICPLTRPTPPSKYLQFEADGDLLDEEIPPELLDMSPVPSSPIATTAPTVCPLKQQQAVIDEMAGDMLDDELPPDLLDSGEIMSPPKSTKITRTVQKKTVDPITQEEIVKTVKTVLQGSPQRETSPLHPPGPSSPRQSSPSRRLPSPCPLATPTSPEEVTPTGAPLPVVPVARRRTRYVGGTPVLPEEERRRKFEKAARKLEYGPCPTEQRLQEIAGEADADFALDQSLPDFVSSFVDDIVLSPKPLPVTSSAALPETSQIMDDLVFDQSAPEFAPSFIDEVPLSPRDVVQAVKHEVITKDGIPQKEITTTTTIPRRLPQRQIPRPGGVITKVRKEVLSKNGIPQQEIVTTETIPQPSTSGIQSRGAISKIPGRPSSRIPSSSKAMTTLERPSETPKRKPPRDVAPDRIRMRLSSSEKKKRQEELAKVRRRLDWSEEECRLEDIEGDLLEQSQPQLVPSFIDEVPLSPLTQQRLQGVATIDERPVVQKTTTETIMKDGVPQKTVTTVETVKASEDQRRFDDIEGDLLDESQPQLASSFVDEISLSPKKPSPEQPCPATITPQGAQRPPIVKRETQQYITQHIAGQTPKVSDEERRKKFAAAARRIDFGPGPSEQRLQDDAATDERPVVQKTTTETIMKDGVPQKTITTVENVKTPEDECRLEDIEGDEILPDDLDTSFMRELERELAEAAAQDVEMLEDEYEGMDKYDEMERELNEIDDAMRRWDTLLQQLEEDHKEDILEVEASERASGHVSPTTRTPTGGSPEYVSPTTTTPTEGSPEYVSSTTRTPTSGREPPKYVFRTRTPTEGSPECVSRTPRIRHTDRTQARERLKRKIDMSQAPPVEYVSPTTRTPTGGQEPPKYVFRTRTPTGGSPENVSRTPRIRYTDRTQARERLKRKIDMSQAPPITEEPPRTLPETVPSEAGPSTSRQDLPPPCESASQVQPLTKEQYRRLMLGDEYDKYEEYKKHRRPDVPTTPPMFSRFKFIRDEAEGTVYEPEEFGVSADEVWQEGAETLKDLGLVRSPTGADAKFFEDETPPELIDQEIEYAKDEEEKKDLNRRLGKVMDDIQRIKNELAESAGLPVTLPRKSPSPRRSRVSSDFLTSESPPRFDELLPDEEQISPLEDDRQHQALQKIISQEEYPELLDESPPPLSPCELPQISEEIDMRSPSHTRRRLFSPPSTSPSPTTSKSPPRTICDDVPQSTSLPTTPTSPKVICPVKASPTEDIDLRQLRRDIQERAVRPRDKPHMDVVLGKTSAKRRRIKRKSPAPEGTFIEREEDYAPPERVPEWQTPPRLKAKPTLSPPQRIREVWDTSHAPSRPVPEPQLDDEGPPEELFSQIVDDYVDGVPVKRTETKVTTSLPHKASPSSPRPVCPMIAIRDKPIPPVQGPGLDDEQPPEELFTQIVDEYVDGVPVKRTETKVTTALPQKEPICQFQPRSPTTIAREEPFALLDESPPRLIDDEEMEQRVDLQADQNLQDIVCRSPERDILDEQEVDLVPTSPTSPRPITSRSPTHGLPVSIPSTSRARSPPLLFYRPSREGEQVMDEVRRGARPFRDMKFEWDVVCGRTRGGKPKRVKRYGRYRRTYVPGLGRVEEFPFCGDGLLEKYAEWPGPPQQPLPEDLMGHEVPITSTPIRERSPRIMDEDVPLGLPSPIGQSRLPGWKTPPHLQYERKKFPKKRSSSRQESPRPGPSTSPSYTKRKQIFVDGSPVKTVETKVSTPSPKGLHDVSDIEFVESPPPSDECFQPQLQAIAQREHFEDLVAQSPPQFEDFPPEEELPAIPEDHGKILQDILSKEVCPGLSGESPPPFSPDQPSFEVQEYDVGSGSPIQIRRRLFPPSSPSSPVSAPIPVTTATQPVLQIPTQTSTSPTPPLHRTPVCPITSPPSPEIDLRRFRREIQERAVRPRDKPHMDVVLGKTSAKRRRIKRKSPAPESTFIEREEEYASPERVPGWQTPPRLKAKPVLSPPQRIREVWDASHAPSRPVPEPQLDDERPPEELFSQIVDDYVDGVPVKRTETKVTTSLPHKASPSSPRPVCPMIAIRDKPIPPVQGPGLDDEQPPEELFTQIVDEYVDGVPVKRTETKVTTALPQKEPICQFQPRSPTTIAREEPFALLDESPPRLIDDEEMEQRVDLQADQNLQDIVCRSPERDILDEQEVDLVPTSPTSPRRITSRSPTHGLPVSIPSTSRARSPPLLFYRPSREGEQVMDEVRRGARPFRDMKFEWDVVCGRTRGGKPKRVKRYGRYRRTYVPGLGRVEEFPFCGDGLLEKYAEWPGPPQQPLPEDLMGHEVPITSTPIRERSPRIMDEDVPLGLPSPIGQSRLPGWKTPPHLQYERKKFPKKRSSSKQESPRPGPSTSPSYTKRKQIFVDGSPVRTVETKVSTPSPKGLHDVSDIEFVESPPPSDECFQPQLQAIAQREHLDELVAQSPPQFEDISSEEDLPTEPEDHGKILQGILSKDVCPGLSGESPPPFSPDQPIPEVEEYDIGSGSPIQIRRRLFPASSPPVPISIPTQSPHTSPICPLTSPPSPEIDLRQLRRQVREKAVRPSDRRHVDVVLGKTSGKRRRIHKQSSGPESRFIEREEDDVLHEAGVPGWSTPPRLVREEPLPLNVPKFDLWTDYGQRRQRSVKPPVVTEITEEMVDGVPVRRIETTVQHTPVGRARVSDESPPPFVQTPPQRSPPEFRSMTQQAEQYSPLSGMSPPSFIASPPITSPRQIPLPSLYHDTEGLLDISQPELVCSPTDTRKRSPRQIALPTVYQDADGVLDTSPPELVCSSPPQQRIKTPRQTPRQIPLPIPIEGAQNLEGTSPPQLVRSPSPERTHSRTPTRPRLSGEASRMPVQAPSYRTSRGSRIFMPTWPDPETPTRSEYHSDIAFGGRSSPGILDTSPISDIGSDEECDFAWMG